MVSGLAFVSHTDWTLMLAFQRAVAKDSRGAYQPLFVMGPFVITIYIMSDFGSRSLPYQSTRK